MLRNNRYKDFIIRELCTSVFEKCQISNSRHVPVMVSNVLDYLKPKNSETILDMTFGAGGHSRKILEIAPDIKLLCLDRDPVAYGYAQKLAEENPNRIVPLLGKFSDLPVLLKENNIKQNSIDSILFDFGCSSMQFDEGYRGFAVSQNGPLDMRMDGDRESGMFLEIFKLSNIDIFKQK